MLFFSRSGDRVAIGSGGKIEVDSFGPCPNAINVTNPRAEINEGINPLFSG
jgi:hypothetical protein